MYLFEDVVRAAMTPSQNMLNDAHDDVRHHSILTS
jgi:hypothetical protein